MKIIATVIFTLLLGISLVTAKVNAFEFHGIKSGMTKEEIRDAWDLEKAAKNSLARNPDFYKDYTVEKMIDWQLNKFIRAEDIEKFSGKVWNAVTFFFDDREKLWRLDVFFRSPSLILEVVALKRVMEERFDTYKGDPSSTGATEKYTATLLDAKLSIESVERISEDYRSRM